MAFSWPRSTYNARASFNRWFRVNYSAAGWPAAYTAGGIPVNFEYPDVPLTFPSFSVTHLGEIDGQRFQGDRMNGGTGSYRYAITEVSCWASGDASGAWSRDLWQMHDMAAYLFQSARSIPLLNVYATTATANLTAIGVLRLGPDSVYEDVEAPMEPSRNVHRLRMLAHWFYRAQV